MLKIVFAVLTTCVLLTGCDFPDIVIPEGFTSEQSICTVYYTSFETESEVDGWKLPEARTYTGGSPIGYNKSLHISGGCTPPHASYTLEPVAHDRRLMLQFWGKAIEQQGMVMLRVLGQNSGPAIYTTVQDTVWTFIQIQDTLLLPAHERAMIWTMSGGMSYGAMLLDNVHVEEVDADCGSLPDPSTPFE